MAFGELRIKLRALQFNVVTAFGGGPLLDFRGWITFFGLVFIRYAIGLILVFWAELKRKSRTRSLPSHEEDRWSRTSTKPLPSE